MFARLLLSYAQVSRPAPLLHSFPVSRFCGLNARLRTYAHAAIIREPLKGIETVCPIGDSFTSTELSLPAWLASPETTIKNFVIAKHIQAEKFLPHTRVVCLPGFTATVRDELEALVKVAGAEALNFIKFKDDAISRRIVSSWPCKFDNTYALSLGFVVDEGGMEPIVRRFQEGIVAGIA